MLFALLMLLFNAGGVSWHAQRAGGNFDLLHLALFPFYLVVLVGSFRRAHDPPPRPSETRLTAGVPGPLVVFGGFIALCVLVGWLDDPGEESTVARNDKATTGCTNSPRDLSTKPGGTLYVIVYDRYCESAPKRTVNVSVQREMETDGPGNVFVAETPDGRRARDLDVMALLGVGSDVEVLYDPALRVIRRVSTLDGATIRFTPSVGSRR
jgi:hypothetical protein